MTPSRFWVPAAMLTTSFLGGGLANVAWGDKEPPSPGLLTARRIQIVDDYDRPRITLGMSRHGYPEVHLLDENENSRLRLFCRGRNGQSAGLAVASDVAGVGLAMEAGYPELMMVLVSKEGGWHPVMLAVGPDGSPLFSLRDMDKGVLFEVPEPGRETCTTEKAETKNQPSN